MWSGRPTRNELSPIKIGLILVVLDVYLRVDEDAWCDVTALSGAGVPSAIFRLTIATSSLALPEYMAIGNPG